MDQHSGTGALAVNDGFLSLQFGTNNTQNVANLGDNWRKVR